MPAERLGPWRSLTAGREPLSFGKINLNTAPLEVLASLPGFGDALATAVDAVSRDGSRRRPHERGERRVGRADSHAHPEPAGHVGLVSPRRWPPISAPK